MGFIGVDIHWTMSKSMRTHIQVDESEIRDWLAESGKVEEQEITADVIKRFLRSGEDEEWLAQSDEEDDMQEFAGAELDDVQIMNPHAHDLGRFKLDLSEKHHPYVPCEHTPSKDETTMTWPAKCERMRIEKSMHPEGS